MVDPGGTSSTWWVTSTTGGDVGSPIISARAPTSCSRPPRSRRADGSSSSTTPGSFISVRASITRCCSPDDSVARAGRRTADAHALETGDGVCPIGVVVGVPPRFESGVPCCHHDVAGRQFRPELGCERSGRVADPAAQDPHVGPSERLAEHAHLAGRGVLVERRDAQEGGLARPVRAQDEPVLAGSDLPGDVVEDPSVLPHERHAGQAQRGICQRSLKTVRRPADGGRCGVGHGRPDRIGRRGRDIECGRG